MGGKGISCTKEEGRCNAGRSFLALGIGCLMHALDPSHPVTTASVFQISSVCSIVIVHVSSSTRMLFLLAGNNPVCASLRTRTTIITQNKKDMEQRIARAIQNIRSVPKTPLIRTPNRQKKVIRRKCQDPPPLPKREGHGRSLKLGLR
jgi:hypothetical protein